MRSPNLLCHMFSYTISGEEQSMAKEQREPFTSVKMNESESVAFYTWVLNATKTGSRSASRRWRRKDTESGMTGNYISGFKIKLLGIPAKSLYRKNPQKKR